MADRLPHLVEYEYADHVEHARPLPIATTEPTVGELMRIDELLSESFGVMPARRRPKPTRVIVNNPAVVTFFDDGTRKVATCKGDDVFLVVKGILICAFKKVGKKERVDRFEWVLEHLSCLTPEDMRTVSRALELAADSCDALVTQRRWQAVVEETLEANRVVGRHLVGSEATDDGETLSVAVPRHHFRELLGMRFSLDKAVRRHFGKRHVHMHAKHSPTKVDE